MLTFYCTPLDISVGLDDGTATAIRRGGWSQRGPTRTAGDVWEDVEETAVVSLLDEDDDTVYSKLMHLAQRAEDVQSPEHRDHLNPANWVIAQAQTPGELMARWALVKQIRVEKLDPAHYRANGRLALEVKFVREGLWRGDDPALSPIELVPYSTHAVATKLTIVNDGYLGSTPVDGDAPPLLNLDIRPYVDAWIAVHAGVSDAGFTPYLWGDALAGAINISSLPAPFNSAAQLPGGKCVALGSSGQIFWTLPLASYYGYYTAYALFLSNADGAVVRFQHGWSGSYQYGSLVAPSASTVHWGIHRLGAFRIPKSGNAVRGVLPSTTYVAGINYVKESGSLYLGGMFLVPDSGRPPQVIRGYGSGYSNPITRVDAGVGQVYWTGSTGIPALVPAAVSFGPFQSLNPTPGLTNFVWLIPVTSPDAPDTPIAAPLMTATGWRVGVRYVPRWQYLNLTGGETGGGVDI
ncbi:MAG: hypothetical protein IPM39_15150 [Chloroflexi bacterium]|nr:hypothetical protein [Chloroflexota bacterium]